MGTDWACFPAKALSRRTTKENSGLKPNLEKEPPSTSPYPPAKPGASAALPEIPLRGMKVNEAISHAANVLSIPHTTAIFLHG